MCDKLVMFSTVLFLILILPSHSFAGYFGIYVDYGKGSGTASYEEGEVSTFAYIPGTWEYHMIYEEEFDTENDSIGIGLQYESRPLFEDKFYSNRFQIGYVYHLEDDPKKMQQYL